jgi:glyoxylase-like metal-dependent hydrolase (beta-lactamase superfamily II)
MKRQILTAIVAGALLAPAGAYAQEKIGSMNGDMAERGLSTSNFPRYKQVAPNIYEYEGLHAPAHGNYIATVSLIVVTTDGVLVVDGQGDPKQGQEMVDNIKKLTSQPVKYMIIASDHGDHTGGNPAFKKAWPNIVFVSSPVSKQHLAKDANPPTETIADKRVFKLGGTEVDVLNLGRAHTGGDLVAYLPQSKVMFMSEVYLRGVFPAMRTAYPSEWIQTIKKAQAMDVSLYIPGHGFVDDPATMKKDLEASRKALEYVYAEGKRLHDAHVPCGGEGVPAGSGPVSCPEAAKQAKWGEYAHWALADTQEAMAIGKVYQELDGKLK